MESKVIKWTDEQQKVISSRGKNLLISASAGSGKTTVMIERIADLVVSLKVPISNFLVVTFTKASASDMKKKLIDKFLSMPVDDFLLKQIESVQNSDISNLHSFCSRLISTYFYKVQVDPSYHVIDDVEASILKEKAILRLFEDKEKSNDEDYFKLFEIFQTKRSDDGLKKAVFLIDGFSNSILNTKDWLIKKIDEVNNLDLKANICAKIINNYVCGQIEDDANLADEFAQRALSFEEKNLYDHFIDISSKLREINYSKPYLVNAKLLFNFSFESSPSAGKEHKFLGKEATSLKNLLKRNLENYKKNYVSYDENEIASGLIFGKRTLGLLLNLVDEFNEIYSRLKKEVNGLDFNDLEKFALEILSDNSVCQDVKSRYKYVFVDEYQDINEVQEKIITLLCGANNRFMVGDIKQSIYRFRFCDPEIFLNSQSKYSKDSENSEVIKLNCNFRSDKKILKFVDMVFSGVMTEKFGGVDYQKDSIFVAGENNLDLPQSVNLCFIDTEKEKEKKELAEGIYSVKNHMQIVTEEDNQAIAEGVYVAKKIAELVSKNNPNKVKYSDIAILVQSRNDNVSKTIETIKSFNIPVSSDDKLDIVKEPYIDEILSFVRFCINQKDDILLYKVLKSRLFNFSDNELVLIRKLDFNVRFYDLIKLFDNLTEISLKLKVQKFLDTVEKFIELSKTLTLKKFVIKIIEDFDLKQINYACEGGVGRVFEIENFVNKLPNIYPFEFVSDFEKFSIVMQNESGDGEVKCTSIHASKGIEYKAVFLINLSKQFSLESLMGNLVLSKELGIGLKYFNFENRTKANSLPYSAISLIEKRKLIEENQRLLYVALTRAVEKLYVVCSKNQSSISSKFVKRPNSFINWFEPIILNELDGRHSEFINFEKSSLSELMLEDKIEKPQLLLSKNSSDIKPDFVYEYLGSVSVPLKNSVTKIINNVFKYDLSELEIDDEYEKFVSDEDKLKINYYADRGTAYHKVFESLDLKNIDNLDNQLNNILNNILTQKESQFIDIDLIKKVINLSFFKEIKSEDKIIKEREFCAEFPATLIFNDAYKNDKFILQGVIDLCIIRNNELIILDYKTGKESKEKLNKYKIQLSLYGDAISRAFKMPVKSAYILFIDEQKLIEI